jgi:N-acetylglucosamine-6-phosphate deacetylase
VNPTRVLAAARVVTSSLDWSPAQLLIEDEKFVAIRPGRAERGRWGVEDEYIPGVIVPAFVDMHVHGALGVDFGVELSDDRVETAIDYHAARGTTQLLASVATGIHAQLPDILRLLSRFAAAGQIVGIHLEGPYLSSVRRGAHRQDLLRVPSRLELETLLEVASGAIRMVTIAPELAGAIPIIRWLSESGVVVALGHSNCDADTARAALDAGATVVTHLFNGMREFHHRDPGLAGVALTDERPVVELILDGHHLSHEAQSLAMTLAAGRVALVSDAMQAAGLADGSYEIAGSAVRVQNGIAVLEDGSSIAGSTATLSLGFARMIVQHGVSIAGAVRATSEVPARALGMAVPDLVAGARADAVVLDPLTMCPTRVLRRGQWLTSPS